MKKDSKSKSMFTCAECGKDFKKLSEACRHLKVFHKIHRRKVWNYLVFDEPRSHLRAVKYPLIV